MRTAEVTAEVYRAVRTRPASSGLDPATFEAAIARANLRRMTQQAA